MEMHEVGGVKQENNNIPMWYQILWWGTWIICVIYLAFTLPKGEINKQEYAEEVAIYEQKWPGSTKKGDGGAGQDYAIVDRSAEAIADGMQTFTTVCAACHKADGSGLVGPSLIDDQWLHTNDTTEMVEMVMVGVGLPGSKYQIKQEPNKGPMTPHQHLGLKKVQNAIAYLETISPSIKK